MIVKYRIIKQLGFISGYHNFHHTEEGWYVAAAIGTRLIEFSSAGGPQGVFKVSSAVFSPLV